MKQLAVVAGIIYSRPKDQVLIALRPAGKHQGNLWEFPGGKVEVGESSSEALTRELEEELGIHVTECSPYMQLEHQYVDKIVALDIWEVTCFTGEASGREQQQIRWVSLAELTQYEFPQANAAIVEKLTLT